MSNATLQPPDGPGFSLAESAGGAGRESLAPDFYHLNPFRLLGLSVLAGPREIAKRVDRLKLSVELGAEPRVWAFAPAAPPTLDEIRASAQCLKNPPQRLLHEFFWFWPESYPHDEPDPALECLTRNDTIRAGEIWSAAAAEGREVAWHNLAVYHHLLALEWEQDEDCEEGALAEVWQQALNYWVQIVDNEALWERMLSRVGLLGDAQLSAESVSRLHAGMADAVAGINAALACHHAERGRMSRVALHVSLVGQIFAGAPRRMAQVLETFALPVARRIETRVEKARQESAATPAALRVATDFVRETARDRFVLETLCGSTSEYYLEHSRLFAGAVLDTVVRYQRETADDRGCLPLLWFLGNVPATPELAERITSALTVIQGNALERLDDPADETGADPESRGRRRICRLVFATLVPGIDQLGLDGVARETYAARLADWLGMLALEACEREDGIDWAVEALTSALELPCDPDKRESLAALRDRVKNDFQLQRARALRLEAGGHTFVVDAGGIAFDGRTLAPGEIIGLRHGIVVAEGGVPPRHIFGWRSAETEYEVSEANLLTSPQAAVADYGRILDAVYFFIVPGLIERLIARLRAGEPLALGDAQLDRTGVMLTPATGTRLWKRALVVPYAGVSYRVADQFLKISSRENPNLVETVDVLQTWNAAIIGYVIDRLARE